MPIDGAVLNGLKVGDISRVQIEKSPDGAAGGWRLRGVKLVVNGRTLYSRDGIERWLEDDHRTWRAPDFRQSGPGGPALPITLDLYDEDSNIYGGDDHGDLNRYDNRRRLALAYIPETVVGTRATGGSYLSGRIGDGDKASVTYTIQTLTPTPAPPRPIPPVLPHKSSSRRRRRSRPSSTPPPPPPPAPKPDLVISAMGWNETDEYFFTVKNQGAGAAGPFTVSVSEVGSFPIAGLTPGASATVTFRTVCWQTTWLATADALAQVSETNETQQHAELLRPSLHLVGAESHNGEISYPRTLG